MDEAAKQTHVELRNSRINVDLTEKYSPRNSLGISHKPSLLAASNSSLYINYPGVASHILGFNIKRDGHTIKRFKTETNNALLDDGDLLTVHHDGAFFDIDYPSGGTLDPSSRESDLKLLNESNFLHEHKVTNVKVSSDQKRLLLYQDNKQYSQAQRVLLVDRSSEKNKILKLNLEDLRPVDIAVGETKFEDEKVNRRRNIYAVTTTSDSVSGLKKIFIFKEDGSMGETIDQEAIKIINGPSGIFYFLTKDRKIGMINTAVIGKSVDESEVKIIFDNPNQDEIIDMVNGTNSSVVFGTKKGTITVLDGSTGSIRGSKELGLKENQELEELSLEPKGKELFYVTKTVHANKGRDIEFKLRSLKLSITQK